MTDWPQYASCQCGDLAVTALSEPRSAVACHCADCQKRTGSAFGIGVVFDKDHIQTTSKTPCTYDRTSERGEVVTHNFCGRCGSTVLWRSMAYPGTVVVAGGAFDDTSWIAPAFHAWTASSHDWFETEHELPRYARTPWSGDTSDNT